MSAPRNGVDPGLTDRGLRMAATRSDPELGRPSVPERLLLQTARLAARRLSADRPPEAYSVYRADGTRRSLPDRDGRARTTALEALALFGSFGDLSGATVLDIGCGPGDKTVVWPSAGADRVIGIDPDPARVAAARLRSEELGLAECVSFETGLGEDLPVESGSVDVVIMTEVMEHLPRPEATLTECRRVLRPDGVVLINFKTYFSPRGSHVNDWLPIPWVHLFFGGETIVRSLSRVAPHNPWVRYHFPSLDRRPLPADVFELADGGLNRMTLRRYRRLIDGCGLEAAVQRLTGYCEGSTELAGRVVHSLRLVPVLDELVGGYVVTVLRNRAPATGGGDHGRW